MIDERLERIKMTGWERASKGPVDTTKNDNNELHGLVAGFLASYWRP